MCSVLSLCSSFTGCPAGLYDDVQMMSNRSIELPFLHDSYIPQTGIFTGSFPDFYGTSDLGFPCLPKFFDCEQESSPDLETTSDFSSLCNSPDMSASDSDFSSGDDVSVTETLMQDILTVAMETEAELQTESPSINGPANSLEDHNLINDAMISSTNHNISTTRRTLGCATTENAMCYLANPTACGIQNLLAPSSLCTTSTTTPLIGPTTKGTMDNLVNPTITDISHDCFVAQTRTEREDKGTQSERTCSAHAQGINDITGDKVEKEAPALDWTYLEKPTRRCAPANNSSKPLNSATKPDKKVHRPKVKKTIHLWEFLEELLDNKAYSPKFITWVSRDDGMFRLVDSKAVARLWGQRKNRHDMTYEKMSRAIRYYYERKIIKHVDGQKLNYQFGDEINERRSRKESAKRENQTAVTQGKGE
ncbi:uncharacterized protein LOC5518230 isoform X2 [Nematostella vectensis]|uniref:uncharacterized protein LOC5518230 isoform X2 n=1 Tax=Nematostella vectensis TaxID=45351 RepID=UPI00139037B0|nr:uncharacterized protein LOC5518230 isoform X2 [Nematostella vectensis]